MDSKELRIKCIELAIRSVETYRQTHHQPAHIMATAKKFEKWILKDLLKTQELRLE